MNSFTAFCVLETGLLPWRETHSSRGPMFLWTFFLYFGAWKRHFCRVVKSTVQGDLCSYEFIFCILAAWKCDFCRAVKPILERDLDSYELISWILTAWKCDFCRVVKQHSWRESSFLLTHFLHLGILKTRILPSRKSTFDGDLDSFDLIFYILGSWKCDFCLVLKPTAHLDVGYFELIFSILAAWKRHFCRVVKSTVQVDLFACKLISAFWRPEKTTSTESWNPQFMGTNAHWSSFFAFWRLENATCA